MRPYFLSRSKNGGSDPYSDVGVECAWLGCETESENVSAASSRGANRGSIHPGGSVGFASAPLLVRLSVVDVALFCVGAIVIAIYSWFFNPNNLEELWNGMRGYQKVDPPGLIVWPSLSTSDVGKNVLRALQPKMAAPEAANPVRPAKRGNRGAAP